MQPVWLCILLWTYFEEMFESTQRRKIKPIQAMWLCILTCRQSNSSFENVQWIKAKQMQAVYLCILLCWQFEKHMKMHSKVWYKHNRIWIYIPRCLNFRFWHLTSTLIKLNTESFHRGFDLWVQTADLFCQTVWICVDSALRAKCGSCPLILKCMSKSLTRRV